MSAFEPQTTEPKVDMPDFMVVLRDSTVAKWRCGPPGGRPDRAGAAPGRRSREARLPRADREQGRAVLQPSRHPCGQHPRGGRQVLGEHAGRRGRAGPGGDRRRREEAAEIIKAAEHRAGEIEGEAQRTLEQARAEGTQVEDALQAAEEMRAQAEQDARAVLEEARDATDMIWQEAERERIGVEAETIRLETLGTGRWSSSDGSTGTWSRCWTSPRRHRPGRGGAGGPGRGDRSRRGRRLGVEPPASSPEESPRFPSAATSSTATTPVAAPCCRPPGPAPGRTAATPEVRSLPTVADAAPEQPALSGTDDSPAGDAEATQPVLGDATTETTEPGDKTEAIQPLAEDGRRGPPTARASPATRTPPSAWTPSAPPTTAAAPRPPKPHRQEGKGRR